MGNLLQPWHVILLLLVPAMIAIAIVPLWMIAKRAGLPPAISLLTVIPFLGFLNRISFPTVKLNVNCCGDSAWGKNVVPTRQNQDF